MLARWLTALLKLEGYLGPASGRPVLPAQPVGDDAHHL